MTGGPIIPAPPIIPANALMRVRPRTRAGPVVGVVTIVGIVPIVGVITIVRFASRCRWGPRRVASILRALARPLARLGGFRVYPHRNSAARPEAGPGGLENLFDKRRKCGMLVVVRKRKRHGQSGNAGQLSGPPEGG